MSDLVAWVWTDGSNAECVVVPNQKDRYDVILIEDKPPDLPRAKVGDRLYIMVTAGSVDLCTGTVGAEGTLYGEGIWPEIWPEYLSHVRFNQARKLA